MANDPQTTRVINLSAKFNNRQNNETIEVDPNTTGFTFVSLTNGDLFNTHSLSSRLGTTNICGGIVDSSGGAFSIANTESSLPSGTTESKTSIQNQQSNIFDYAGSFYIPSGNNFNLFTGSVYLSDSLSPASYASLGAEVGYDLKFKMYVYTMDQAPFPSSGVGWMTGTSGGFNGIKHNIALSGNYNVPPYPVINTTTPVAISDPITFNPGPYVFDGSNYVTPTGTLPYIFTAPYSMNSGNVYWLKPQIQLTSGTQNRSVNMAIVTSASEISPNTRLGQEFLYIGAPVNQNHAVRLTLGGEKSWIKTKIQEYISPSYLLTDIKDSNYLMNAPITSGTFPATSPQYPSVVYNTAAIPQTGSTTPPFSTQTVEFGQVVHIPSGTWNIFGSYFLANTYSGSNVQGNKENPWTRNGVAFPPTNFNAGYVSNFSSIDNTSGAITGSNYAINNRTILSSFSGNHIFSNPNDYPNNPISNPVYNVDKIYSMYNNPVTIQTTGHDYLLSFKFYDFVTGGDMTDYNSASIGTFTTYSSPFVVAAKTNTSFSGAYVASWSGTNSSFQQYNLSPTATGNTVDLVCGLIYIPSGNAITSVYDYRVGDSRSQKIIYTIQDQVKGFDLSAPAIANHVVLHSGSAIGNNFKWSHSTFQNDLFSHQYSQSSGLYWDQIYSGTTNSYMQNHGLRPAFTLSEVVAGTGIGATGNGASYLSSGSSISVILGTQLNSGGIRASITGNIATTGTKSYVKISGLDMFNPVGLSLGTGTSQYKFDVAPGQPTYVFTTENSGSTFYLAQLYTGTSVNTLSLAPNPIPNTGTFPQYIENISGPSTTGTIALTQQVSQVIINPQEYLTNQIDVPKFKKTIVYKNLLIGIGDATNPSRLWYSELQAPNIYGVDTNFYGFYDIDNDNGQELTGIEIFKDYLIIFKQNSTYRANFTANPGDPLDFFKLSSTIGNLGIFATVATDYGVFGLSQYGPILASYAGADTIGDEIFPYYQGLDHTSLIFSVAIHDRDRQQIYWSISNQDLSPDRNTGLTYSYAEKAWTIRENGMWNAGAASGVGDADNFTLLYCGDVLGQIFALDNGASDQDVLFNDSIGNELTKNVTLIAATPWMNLGNSQNQKMLKNMRVNCDSSSQRLKVDVYFDQDDSTIVYSRYLSMNVPVINRVISLAQKCRTVKFVMTSVGSPSKIKLNSIQFGFRDMGPVINI